MIVISGHSPQAEQHKAFQASHIRVRLLPELLHIIVLGNARTGSVDLLDQLPDGVLVKIYIGDGGEQPLHQQQSLLRSRSTAFANELLRIPDQGTGQPVLRRCGRSRFPAHACPTGTGSPVGRLLTLETKHLLIHKNTPFAFWQREYGQRTEEIYRKKKGPHPFGCGPQKRNA